jgi:hypothetical protein
MKRAVQTPRIGQACDTCARRPAQGEVSLWIGGRGFFAAAISRDAQKLIPS